ncbi:cell wall-binding repeat-containing protein [Herbiconiux daphne]|uniref:Cell wall-binding repeat-containing protein n=1 Tax=Herbiconiux daphne TaxID=2970914 RepID=A0ABT2H643_9MICO|nr:cell wall-binding repeat-containing protein [Herbiconiux daphne]MCS5735403.1 cell wall-binding repeat-containing protein [Herbiconiux daphne]
MNVSQVYVRNTAASHDVIRIGGADRYDVSAAVSADRFMPDLLNKVFVASGAVFPDALSASAAAGALGGPVLLATRDALSPTVEAELTRLTPDTIYVLGGTNTISAAVEARLKDFASVSVQRLGGADRFEVSAAISAALFTPMVPVAYVASGETFPDALSGSAAAGQGKGPVLLTSRTSTSKAVTDELTRLQPKKIVVLGGENTIASSVLTSLQAVAPTSRIGGADRFEVSAAVSASVFAPNTETVYVASGAVFPDALSGSAAAIRSGSPVLLVLNDRVPASVAAELRRLKPNRVVLLGGTATVSDTVMNDLKAIISE